MTSLPRHNRRRFLQTLGFSAAALLANGTVPRVFAQSTGQNEHLFLFGDWGAINAEPQQHFSRLAIIFTVSLTEAFIHHAGRRNSSRCIRRLIFPAPATPSSGIMIIIWSPPEKRRRNWRTQRRIPARAGPCRPNGIDSI